MSDDVELVRLATQDVGGLPDRLSLGPFSRGLSLITGQSQAAKAALIAALRAGLFARHDAADAVIQALQSRETRRAPEVWVEVALGDERVSLHKRFLEAPLSEVRFHHDGAVITGATADEAWRARVDDRGARGREGAPSVVAGWGLLRAGSGEPPVAGPRSWMGASVSTAVDPVAAALDLGTQQVELTAQLGELERQLPELEALWSRAVAAEAEARALDAAATEAEIQLANAEAVLDAAHQALTARVALVGAVEAGAIEGTAAQREALAETLRLGRAEASDGLLQERHAAALAALTPAHRSVRTGAAALDFMAPDLLRVDTIRAQGAINGGKRRAAEVRARLAAVRAWLDGAAVERSPGLAGAGRGVGERRRPTDEAALDVLVRLSLARRMAGATRPLPLILDDDPPWSGDDRLVSMVELLLAASSDLQILVLTAHPERFNRLPVAYAADLDAMRQERRGALDRDLAKSPGQPHEGSGPFDCCASRG